MQLFYLFRQQHRYCIYRIGELTAKRKFGNEASTFPGMAKWNVIITFVFSHHCNFIMLNSIYATENPFQCSSECFFESTAEITLIHCLQIKSLVVDLNLSLILLSLTFNERFNFVAWSSDQIIVPHSEILVGYVELR